MPKGDAVVDKRPSLLKTRGTKSRKNTILPFTGKFPKIKLTLRPIDVLVQKSPSA